MRKLVVMTVAAAAIAGSALACNPWVSPTDTTCVGMVMSVTATAPVVPQYNAVTPTGVVTGTLAVNTNGSVCILSATSWVKLTGPTSACGFSPASGL